MELLQLCRVEEGNRPPLISERKWPQSGIFTALIFEARQMPDEANWEKEENGGLSCFPPVTSLGALEGTLLLGAVRRF